MKSQISLACSKLPGLPIVVSIALLSAALLLQILDAEAGKQLTEEGGPIETVSAGLWALGFAIAVVALTRYRSAAWLAGTMMLGWAFLRELDIQTAFTYRSIESLGYYTRPFASAGEKLLVVAALVPFAIAGGYLVWRLWRDLLERKFGESAYSGYVMLGLILLTIGMSCEKIFSLTALEEVAELCLAFNMLLLTTVRHRSYSRILPRKGDARLPVKTKAMAARDEAFSEPEHSWMSRGPM